MSTTNAPWPCPVCAELILVGLNDCPYCRTSAEWIDAIGALDFAIRRFELWKLEGGITKDQYRTLVLACRQRRAEYVTAAQRGLPVPTDAGLPPLYSCWYCRTPSTATTIRCSKCAAPLNSPEVRLLRFQSYLCNLIQHFTESGHLSKDQWQKFLSETPERQLDLLARLEKGWVPLS